MVRVQDFESSRPGSYHGQGHCVVFLCKTLKILMVHLFNQVYIKWLPAKLMLWVTL